jgi:hypothetical protein
MHTYVHTYIHAPSKSIHHPHLAHGLDDLGPALVAFVVHVLQGLNIDQRALVAFVVKVFIHLHKQLQHILCQTRHCRVPVIVGIVLQGRDQQRQDGMAVLRHERDEVLVVPQEECTFRDLKVGRVQTESHAFEERHHNLFEFCELDEFQDVFEFVEEETLLGAVGCGPETQETHDDGFRHLGVFLHKLRHAIRQLLVEDHHVAHLLWSE